MKKPAVECRDESDEHDGSEGEATRPTHDDSYVPDYPARLTRSGLIHILDEAPPNRVFCWSTQLSQAANVREVMAAPNRRRPWTGRWKTSSHTTSTN